MPISRSKPPSTYVPYNYLTLRGGTVGTSIKLTDGAGNPVDLTSTEQLLLSILNELTIIRLILSESSEISISNDEINTITEDNDGN
jgi:hypothetical protein